MAISAKLTTYEDGSAMDSFTTGIVNIDPTETPFVSSKPVVKMTGMIHENFYDNHYQASTEHNVLEGADTSVFYAQAPTSQYFLAEIVRAAYKVTRHEYETIKKTGVNPFTRERFKAAKVIKAVQEKNFILGTQVSGATNVAQKTKGIVSLLSSYTYTTATQALTESGIASYLSDCWARGTKVDELYLPITLKRKFATFVGSETVVNADASDKRIISKKDFYESDAADLVKVFKSRILSTFYLAQSGMTASICSLMFGVQSDLVKVGVFGNTTVDEDKPDSLYDTYRGKMQMTSGLIITNPMAGFVAANNI